MTNELEKQFFDTFGIEANCQNTFINPSKCPFIESRECCDCVSFEYPQISDRILLELICIITEWDNVELFAIKDVEKLKEKILNQAVNIITNKEVYCDDFDEKIKHQVQALFEEG